MVKKLVTKKVKKSIDENKTITLKKEFIDLLRPFFNMGYPARKVAMRTTDIHEKKVKKMPHYDTILRYYNHWKSEHTYAIREDLAKHQREIKSELVDQYEEIIIESVRYYNISKQFVDDNKDNPNILQMPYLTAIKQLTDHNTLIGELLSSKARLEMAPFIDQTSEAAHKKKLEQEVEQATITAMKEVRNP